MAIAASIRVPKLVRRRADLGLRWRAEFGRGGTAVGVARARDLRLGRVSLETVRRMGSYFARHEVDKDGRGFYEGDKGFPSAGRIAWELWGGDAGMLWAQHVLKKYGLSPLSKR